MTFEDIHDRMLALAATPMDGDYEECHTKADDLLVALITSLSGTSREPTLVGLVLEAYERVPKWYS